MNLENLRKRIDSVDIRLVNLLRERMELSIQTRKFKATAEDKEREEEIKSKLSRTCGPLVSAELLDDIFSRIISEGKALQNKEKVLIGFQGETGAYSEIAAIRMKDAIPIPCNTFSEVIEGVFEGRLDLGILPIENSIEGGIDEALDSLISSGLSIIAEIRLPIEHCLLACKGTDHRQLRRVFSHPQALSQCRGFISRNTLEPHVYFDTAGAARKIATEVLKDSTAIASARAAEVYGLDIIKEKISDNPQNNTRFAVIGRDKSLSGSKTTIVFRLRNKAGSLAEILNIFSRNKLNLSRIESRPIRNDPSSYLFILDFEAGAGEKAGEDCLKEISEKAMEVRILGSYDEV